MTKATIAGGTAATVIALFGLAAGYRALGQDAQPAAATTASPAPEARTHPGSEDGGGFLYGRITTLDGATHEGRLRFGGAEEAFWNDYFNGFKDENPWAAHVPAELLPKERHAIRVFGFELWSRENRLDLGRPLMARFGDIARIDAKARDIRVTLKSGAVSVLDRFSADDLADGLRVWDIERGVVDFGEWRIRTIEFLPDPSPGAAPYRLHGTVHTRQGGEFTGFVQWNREEGVGTDTLDGLAADGKLKSPRFDTIRSVARGSSDGTLVTLLDGSGLALSGTRDVGEGNRGMYVDDPRYGRVLVSWDAFEHVDLTPGGSGPSYGDFPPGQPLAGTVTTRDGRSLAGRLVFDLDESETTETLDAPSKGVDYTIPFGLVASIVPAGQQEGGASLAKVTLHSGEELRLEPEGDLAGWRNAGMLVFVDGRDRPEYVPWIEVERVAFERPADR